MKALVENTRNIAVVLELNVDRLLVPLIIVGALTLAGWLVSYAPSNFGI